MFVTANDREAIKEMVTDHAWEIIKSVLQSRREAAIHSLLNTVTFEGVLKEQARVGEIDALLRLPHEIINQGEVT